MSCHNKWSFVVLAKDHLKGVGELEDITGDRETEKSRGDN